ncbi:hypothetical protein CHCC20342_3004 [Bacillus licheniformis]|nr:hypothetical protein CHCC20342_3004 [Bacillus licheniformis]
MGLSIPKRYGFFPYIFLIYLLLPISYLTNQTSGIKQLIGFGLVLLFLVTYRQLFLFRRKKNYLLIGWPSSFQSF